MLRNLVVKKAQTLSHHALSCNRAIYASRRGAQVPVGGTWTYKWAELDPMTDPNHPDYIDPKEIQRLAKEMEDKGVPNSAGDYDEMARRFLFMKLRQARQTKFVYSNIDKYSQGQNGLPDEVDKSAY